jgi:cell wall-associated NlpC family hydrolase
MQYLNYKYVSGGSSPSTGFDCSGFTTYVYKNFGISLSRTSTGQGSNGVSVSKSNLQLGDILIFNNSSNTAIGHVGIYIGNNEFIHAANPSSGVKITKLSDSYYSLRYVDARRVL